MKKRMTGEEFLRQLQDKATNGFHKEIGWVDDKSSVAKALLSLDEENS